MSLIISYIDVKRKGISVWGNNKPLLFVRGAVGTAALMCVYYAVTTLPLAEATILQYVHPVFTALLGVLFLKERVQKSTMICIAFCLAGLLVMVQPSMNSGASSELPLFSIMVALCGAFGSSIAYVIVRKTEPNRRLALSSSSTSHWLRYRSRQSLFGTTLYGQAYS